MSQDDKMPAALEKLMREHGFTGETCFRRQTLSELPTPAGETGVLAVNVGPGLAFTVSQTED